MTALAPIPDADEALVDPFGLPAPAVAGVALVLSHLLGTHGVGHNRHVVALLRNYAHAEVKFAGETLPGPVPEVELDGRRPQGHDQARLLGFTPQTFKDNWQRHKLLQGSDAPMETDLLVRFVPAELWRVVAVLIAEGPGLAADRLNVAMNMEAGRAIRRTRRHRPDAQKLSQSSLRGVSAAARALLRSLVSLSTSTALAGSLQAWQRVPDIVTPTSDEPTTDTTAPARWRVRALWQRTAADVAQRLPQGYADELQAIAAVPPSRLRDGGLFMPLRTRALLVLLVVCGLRVDAIARLRVGDYVREWPSPDGEIGPAIAVRPRKTRRDEWVSPKPLPAGAAAVIEAYLAFMTRVLGPLGPDAPLLHRDRKGGAWTTKAIMRCVAGVSRKHLRQRALIPLGPDPCHGYTCHTYRSAAAQMVRSIEAHEWLTAERVSASQHWLAEALLDHGLAGLDALYGGASKDQDRERLTAIATEVTWRMLTTELGARRGPDADTYRRTLHARLALQGELDHLSREVDAAFAEPPRRRKLGVQDLVERLDALLRAHALVRRERQARDELAAIDRELELLRVDPSRQVALPDTAGAEPADLQEVEREVLADVDDAPRRGRPRVKRRRRWISMREFAELAGVSAATVPRWAGQGGRAPQLPFADGDPRNPWTAARVPIDESLGAKRRRILVDGISQSWLAGDAQRARRLDELLALDGPDGWTPEQCAAALVPPAWMT